MEPIIQSISDFLVMLYPYIIAIIPTLTAISTCTAIAVAIMCKFKELKKDVKDKTDLSDARAEMKQIIAEDRALKRRLDKMVAYQEKVAYHDPDKKI